MKEDTKLVIFWTVVIVVCIGVIGGLAFGIPAFQRYQKVQNAKNQVHVNEIVARQTQQLIDNERQKAQIRIEEAKGIAEAQKLINQTLTDRYLQHEAIQAQLKMANSPNHTQIYIPVGQNGIPLVKTVDVLEPSKGK